MNCIVSGEIKNILSFIGLRVLCALTVYTGKVAFTSVALLCKGSKITIKYT